MKDVHVAVKFIPSDLKNFQHLPSAASKQNLYFNFLLAVKQKKFTNSNKKSSPSLRVADTATYG